MSHPETFTARVSNSREGWIAVHAHDWSGAVASGGDPAARAHQELARFYSVLAGLDAEVWSSLGEHWTSRGTLPVGSQLPWFIGTALADAGRGDEAARWRSALTESPTLAARRALHESVRTGAAPAGPLHEEAFATLLREPFDGGTRDLADPWLLRTLSLVELRESERQPPLDRGLFSGDLGRELTLPPPSADAAEDADACRTQVRGLDAELDAWRVDAVAGASAEGKALLTDLRLVESTRAAALVDLGITALNADRPSCALAIAQLALDHESPRSMGAANSPTLFAVVASAATRVGRTREALDALGVLVPAYPETTGLNETLGTLVVLEGLDRRGDSRE